MANAQSLRRLNVEARKRAIMKLRVHRARKMRGAMTLLEALISLQDDDQMTEAEADAFAGDDKKH